MKQFTLIKNSNTNDMLFYIKMCVLLFSIFLISFFVLAYPGFSSEGIKAGITLCFDKLIPSLFPLMIISSFILKSEAYKSLSLPFLKITQRLFRLSDEAFPVILMSFIGGYPIGAIMTASLYNEKKISDSEAKHLMTFCANPSISFCLVFIGSALYGQTKTGLIIYLSSIIPSLFTGIVYGRLKKDAPCFSQNRQKRKERVSLSSAFTEAVSDSTAALTGICTSVIIFSSMLNLPYTFTVNPHIHSIFSFLLEITNFAQKNYGAVPLEFMSAAVSFGGICTHFQIIPYLLKMKISYKHFLIYRLINMLLSYLISRMLFYVFPPVISTSSGYLDKAVISKAGIPVSCTLIAMAVIIIFTDNAISKIKESTKI